MSSSEGGEIIETEDLDAQRTSCSSGGNDDDDDDDDDDENQPHVSTQRRGDDNNDNDNEILAHFDEEEELWPLMEAAATVFLLERVAEFQNMKNTMIQKVETIMRHLQSQNMKNTMMQKVETIMRIRVGWFYLLAGTRTRHRRREEGGGGEGLVGEDEGEGEGEGEDGMKDDYLEEDVVSLMMMESSSLPMPPTRSRHKRCEEGGGGEGLVVDEDEDGMKHHYLEEDVFALMMMTNVFESSSLPMPPFLRTIGERFGEVFPRWCLCTVTRFLQALCGIGVIYVLIFAIYGLLFLSKYYAILLVLAIGILWWFMSSPWFLGMVTFGIVIIYDQWINTRIQCEEENKGTAEACVPFNIPLRVGEGVNFAQISAVILVLATQTDILSSIQTMLLLKNTNDEGWDKVIGGKGSGDNGRRSWPLWIVRIFIPNTLKLVQAVLILFTSFVIIIQSETIAGLLKDFTVVLVISHADNLMFYVAVQGYFGNHLKRKAVGVKAVHWEIDTIDENDDNPDSGTRSVVADVRAYIFGMICIVMIGGVSFVINGQYSYRWTRWRYPDCDFFYDGMLIGNGYCNSLYNTEACGWDGGDCLIDGYPDCHVENPHWFGNGNCQRLYNTEACGWGGGACIEFNEKYPDCDAMRPGKIGDGRCDNFRPYNTLQCGFDEGDCVPVPVDGYPDCILRPEEHEFVDEGECEDIDVGPYNTKECGFGNGGCERNPVTEYADCFVHSPHKIGDGRCHSGVYNTAACGFDGGDCDLYNEKYPDCDASEPFEIGDGRCDGGVYNTVACGFDEGDCDLYNGLTDCDVEYERYLGDGYCSNFPPYNTPECNFDGGDCVQKFNAAAISQHKMYVSI